MSVEIDCDFCVNVTPEFDNQIILLEINSILFYFIEKVDNQFLDNNISKFYSRGPPQI